MAKFKYLLITLLVVLIAFGSISLIIGLTKNKDRKEITANDFYVGGIDSEGQTIDSETTFVTDKIGVQGLSIVPNFDSEVTYKVYYYDALMNLKLVSEEHHGAYSPTVSDNIKFCRIQIFLFGKKASFWNKNHYVSQLDISVNKNQVIETKEEKIGLSVDKVIIHYKNGISSTMKYGVERIGKDYNLYQIKVTNADLYVESYEIVFNRKVSLVDGASIPYNYYNVEFTDNSVILTYTGDTGIQVSNKGPSLNLESAKDILVDMYGNKLNKGVYAKVTL